MVPSNAVLLLWLVSAIETYSSECSLDTVHSRTAVDCGDIARTSGTARQKLAINLRSVNKCLVTTQLAAETAETRNGHIRSTKLYEATPTTIGHAQTYGITQYVRTRLFCKVDWLATIYELVLNTVYSTPFLEKHV